MQILAKILGIRLNEYNTASSVNFAPGPFIDNEEAALIISPPDQYSIVPIIKPNQSNGVGGIHGIVSRDIIPARGHRPSRSISSTKWTPYGG